MATQDDVEIPKTNVFGGGRARARFIREPSVFDAAAGIAVLSFAILGLAGVVPRTMAALSFLGVGLAAMFEGASIARRYRRMLSSHGKRENSEIRWAMIALVAGGGVGLVLALLALFGIEPLAFLAIASAVFGASLLLGTGAEVEVDSATNYLEPSETGRAIHQAVIAAGGARLLVAVASIVLGVLAFAGVATQTLLLAASLALGVALLLGSISVGDRLSPREYSENPTA